MTLASQQPVGSILRSLGSGSSPPSSREVKFVVFSRLSSFPLRIFSNTDLTIDCSAQSLAPPIFET